jgi:hypothetical protein
LFDLHGNFFDVRNHELKLRSRIFEFPFGAGGKFDTREFLESWEGVRGERKGREEDLSEREQEGRRRGREREGRGMGRDNREQEREEQRRGWRIEREGGGRGRGK